MFATIHARTNDGWCTHCDIARVSHGKCTLCELCARLSSLMFAALLGASVGIAIQVYLWDSYIIMIYHVFKCWPAHSFPQPSNPYFCQLEHLEPERFSSKLTRIVDKSHHSKKSNGLDGFESLANTNRQGDKVLSVSLSRFPTC